MRHEYPRPGNEHEFEDFCLRFYRSILKNYALVLYAKRGQKQDGIDIIDLHAVPPLVAIQCKRHEPSKHITPAEIKAEVKLAENSQHRIGHYIIATTAKKSKQAQDTVIELNARAANEKVFDITIEFWEDINERLMCFPRAIADFIAYGDGLSEEEYIEIIVAKSTAYSKADLQVANSSHYEEINLLIADRKLEAADHELSKLPNPEAVESLSNDERYAILRLRAKLALERQQFVEASRLFMLAYEISPNLEQARLNYVLALGLSNKRKEAFREATRMFDEGVRSSILLAHIVRLASSLEDLDPYLADINDCAQNDEDINVALVYQYINWNQLELAKASAIRAAGISPDSAHVLYSQGTVEHYSIAHGDPGLRQTHIQEAINFYNKAEIAAKKYQYFGLLPEILINRAKVHSGVGSISAAGLDYRAAVKATDKPELYAIGAIEFFLFFGDYDSAWGLLPDLSADTSNYKFFSLLIEYHFADLSDRKSIVKALRDLADTGFARSTEARFHCVQWAVNDRDLVLARECVPESFVESNPFQGYTLLAWIELECEDTAAASENAKKALDASAREAHRQEISVLGIIFTRLGDDESALPLLEQASTPGVLDDDCKRLFAAAQRLDRHDVLIRICDDLRGAGQLDDYMRKFYVQLFSQYLPERALQLAKEFQVNDLPYFTAAANFIATTLERPEELNFESDELQFVGHFIPEEAYLVVVPLIYAGHVNRAMQFLYQQLRQNPTNKAAHFNYMGLFLEHGEQLDLPTPSVVTSDTAIFLKNVITNQSRWVILEAESPNPVSGEVSPLNEPGTQLIGKNPGDTVYLLGPSIQKQLEEIIEIQSKYVRKFQETFESFQARFPEAGLVQTMHVENTEGFDPTPLIESLKARRDGIDRLTKLYHEDICSLHLLAKRLGLNERQLIRALCESDKWFVRCVECSPTSFGKAVDRNLAGTSVVLELSAIVTIAQLNVWDMLDESNRYFVSRSTLGIISSWVGELSRHGGSRKGYAGLSDEGNMYFHETTDDELQRDLSEVRCIESQVRSLCTVKDSLSLAAFDPKRRKSFMEFCGRHAIESLAIAKDEEAIVWSDDYFVGLVAQAEMNVERIWTQLAVGIFCKQANREMFDEVTAKLVGWNYDNTIWWPASIVAAGKLSNWDSSAWPLKQCIDTIGKASISLPRKTRIVIDTFRLLRRSSCLELRLSPIVQAILDSLDSVFAAEWMLRQIDLLFTIDIPSANYLSAEIKYWLRLR